MSKESEIIDAAIDLVAEGGLDNLSTRQIAAKAGCSVGLVNKHFESKENLVKSCIDKIWSDMLDAQKESISKMAPIKEVDAYDRMFVEEYIRANSRNRKGLIFYMHVWTSHYSGLIMDTDEESSKRWFDAYHEKGIVRNIDPKYRDMIDEWTLFSNVLMQIAAFGAQMAFGKMPDNEGVFDIAYRLIFNGAESLFDRE